MFDSCFPSFKVLGEAIILPLQDCQGEQHAPTSGMLGVQNSLASPILATCIDTQAHTVSPCGPMRDPMLVLVPIPSWKRSKNQKSGEEGG